MGMMTPAELQRLLMIQWERKPPLPDVLVKLRILSQTQVDELLAAYREAMERQNVVIKRFVPPRPHLESDTQDAVLSESEAVAMMV